MTNESLIDCVARALRPWIPESVVKSAAKATITAMGDASTRKDEGGASSESPSPIITPAMITAALLAYSPSKQVGTPPQRKRAAMRNAIQEAMRTAQ